MKHIRGFDGLRALAVLGVIFFHMGWSKYGWAGVPLFFVLSGFLITGILVDNKSSDTRTFFTTFYARRSLRIFPLYFLYLAVVAVLYAYVDVHSDAWGWFVFYAQNYYLAAHNFKLPTWMPLLHTWSLAVEEQFYLIWPLVVFFTPARLLKHVSILLVAASFASHAWLNEFMSFWSFAFLTSNLSSLCLGALLAILARENQSSFRKASVAMLVGGGVAVAAIYTLPLVERIEYSPVLTFSLTVFFAGAVGSVAAHQRAARLLEWQPISYVGKISYGLYIWHVFAIALIDIALNYKWVPGMTEIARDGWRIVLSFSFAIASYHLFEAPILRLKNRFGYGKQASGRHLGDATV